MAKEIERKYLVKNDSYLKAATCSYDIRQGYLNVDPASTVRVRTKGDRGFLTVKGITTGCSRNEWEYEIPLTDAIEMLEICSNVLEKTRYQAGRWEVDVFHGANEGLVMAEIELDDPEEQFDLPDFIGEEITGNPKYYNSVLAQNLR